MAEQRGSRSPESSSTESPLGSAWPEFRVVQRVNPDGSVEIMLTSPAREPLGADPPTAYAGFKDLKDSSPMVFEPGPVSSPAGHAAAVRNMIHGSSAGDVLQNEETPIALAHKAGEAFFTPADTAEVILGQALLRRRRMEEIEERYGLFKSEQVARLSGSEAKNTAQIAHRWQKQGRIFAVPVQGAPRFPGFQFDEHGQPRPVIAEILRTLDLSDRGWAVAIWFDTPHASIAGQKSPATALAKSPEQALEAARATQRRSEDWA